MSQFSVIARFPITTMGYTTLGTASYAANSFVDACAIAASHGPECVITILNAHTGEDVTEAYWLRREEVLTRHFG
jgi:hypothetical protein